MPNKLNSDTDQGLQAMERGAVFPTRKHIDFVQAKAAYDRGENLTRHLRQQLGVDQNTPEIIEMAYDIQAGSYIRITNESRSFMDAYTAEIAGVLNRHLRSGDSLLDIGCGELTTLSLLAGQFTADLAGLYAFDISWSRIRLGLEFAATNMKTSVFDRLHVFAAEISEIPLVSKSVDVVMTSHALEPNGGRERVLLSEIFRVARRHAIFFEPSYELNSPEGRERMDRLGYVKNLGDSIAALGATLMDVIPLTHLGNPLNPTAAYVVALDPAAAQTAPQFSDPGFDTPLLERAKHYFSPHRGLSYPIIEGIPVLRSTAAVLTSALAAR